MKVKIIDNWGLRVTTFMKFTFKHTRLVFQVVEELHSLLYVLANH